MFRSLVVEGLWRSGLLDHRCGLDLRVCQDDYKKGRKRGLIPERQVQSDPGSQLHLHHDDVEYLQPFVVAEATNERVRLQGYFASGGCDLCHYGVHQGDHRMCEMTGGWERAIVKMMNPKLRSRVTKTRGVGDYACEVCIEWKQQR